MKKAIFAIMLATPSLISAQPFLGLGMTNSGTVIQVGALSENVEISASYKAPLMKNDRHKVLSLQFGKRIVLSNQEERNFVLTPSFGIANLRRKDFSLYDADPTGKSPIIQVNQFSPFYGIEIGKDSYCGRFFLAANYSKEFYFSVGIKMFTSPQ